MTQRQTFSLDDIKAMLLSRVEDVAMRYAPPAGRHYVDKGRYFTLNPGRADRSVGSFCVTLSGPHAGHWNDYATGDRGDLLDLIALSLGCSLSDAVREARGFLGLQTASPEDLARQRRAAEAAVQRRREAEAAEKDRRQRRAKAGHAIWLAAREGLRHTPVESYLRDARGIDLAAIGRQPRALRYAPACHYHQVDETTGEIFEGTWPAMVALLQNGAGEVVGCHRTWLAMAADGTWHKAPVPKPKKVLGWSDGCWINIWSGTGPRGGKAGSLRDAPPGTVVHIAEGIEDALSAAVILPEARHIACVSLSNMAALAGTLPRQVTEVVLLADRDAGAQAQAQLARAVEAHGRAGRVVRLWQNEWGGKDLNDALRAAGDETQDERGVA